MITVDPKEKMSWEELLNCELVVVGRCVEVEGTRKIHVQVDRVLCGDTAQNGEIILVPLEHWYSIGVGSGHAPLKESICYKKDRLNGELSRLISDPALPAIYFFPDQDRPALVRDGQFQNARFAEDWRCAIDGIPTGLLFRLFQNTNPVLKDQALDELCRHRDQRVIEELFQWIDEGFFVWFARDTLRNIGDWNGDVYKRAVARLEKNGRDNVFGQIIKAMDAQRASESFRRTFPLDEELKPTKEPLVPVKLPEIDWESAGRRLKEGRRGDRFSGDLIEVSDKKAVPILVGILCDLSSKELEKAHGFRGALFHYARVFPNAMARELRERGRLVEFHPENSVRWDLYWEELRQILGTPGDYDELREMIRKSGDYHWLPGHPQQELFLKAARADIDRDLGQSRVPDIISLKILQELDRDTFKGFMDALVPSLKSKSSHSRSKSYWAYWADVICLAIRCGHTELTGDLIDRIETSIYGFRRLHPACASPLLDCGDPRARDRYVQILRDFPASEIYRNTLHPGPKIEMLRNLLFDHTDVFMEEIVPLLKSSVLSERREALGLLVDALGWDCGFDGGPFRPDGETALREGMAVLQQFRGLSETEIRAFVLAKHGVILDGVSNEKWLPVLTDAVSSEVPAVSWNALNLIGMIVGYSPLLDWNVPLFVLRREPAIVRDRLVRAFLEDYHSKQSEETK